MKICKNNLWLAFFGFVTGVLNGLFGAGGGIVAVEVLKNSGLDRKRAQSTSIAVILPLCIISAVILFFKNQVDYKTALMLIPPGLVGAFAGTYLMKKISVSLLKKIFCGFMIWAGIRLIYGG